MATQYEIQGLTLTEYGRIHTWLNENIVKPDRCSNCQKIGFVENALISGKLYEKKVENYIHLCKSCHSKYDARYRTSIGLKNTNRSTAIVEGKAPIEYKLPKKAPIAEFQKKTGKSKYQVYRLLKKHPSLKCKVAGEKGYRVDMDKWEKILERA